MNLLAGLEKFGISSDEELDITKEEGKATKASSNEGAAVVVEKEEKDFLLDKKIKCPICDKPFTIKAVTTTRLKRLEPDFDLRPNFEGIDTIKYDALSCPNCGYSALASTFAKIDSARIKLVRNEFCANFKPVPEQPMETFTYEYAIEKFKLALVCTMKKRGKLSEKAYCCLKIAWLRRAQLKELEAAENPDQKLIEATKAEFEGFYAQAYEGFMKAVSTETGPYCGMDSSTVEFMLANMARYYKKYDVALKLIARLIQSPTTGRKLKDKCVDMKQEIVAEAKATMQ